MKDLSPPEITIVAAPSSRHRLPWLVELCLILICVLALWPAMDLSWRELLRLSLIGAGVLCLQRRAAGATVSQFSPRFMPEPREWLGGGPAFLALVFIFVTTEFDPAITPGSSASVYPYWFFAATSFLGLGSLFAMLRSGAVEGRCVATWRSIDTLVLGVCVVVVVLALSADYAFQGVLTLSSTIRGLRPLVYLALWFAITRSYGVDDRAHLHNAERRPRSPVHMALFFLFGFSLLSGIVRGAVVLTFHHRATSAMERGNEATALAHHKRMSIANQTLLVEYVSQGDVSKLAEARQQLELGSHVIADSPVPAEEHFLRALTLAENLDTLGSAVQADAHYALANLYERYGKPDLAAREFLRHLEAGDARPQVVAWGIDLLRQIADWKNIGRVAVDYPDVELRVSIASVPLFLYYAGRALATSQRDADASDYFERTILANPTFGDAYFRLGELREVQGDLSAAIDLFVKTTSLVPSHLGALDNLRRLSSSDGAFVHRLDREIGKLSALNPASVQLGSKIRFLGHEVRSETGDETTIRLFFECTGEMETDYVVSLFGDVEDSAILETDRVAHGSALFAHRPAKPTTTWQIGEVYVDEYRDNINAGAYDLRFGLDTYTAADGGRSVLSNEEDGEFWVRLGRTHVLSAGSTR